VSTTRSQAASTPAISVRTLTDGGQTSATIAQELAEFVGAADGSLDLALYDLKLGPATAQVVGDAIRAAAARGVEVRLAYNVDHGRPIAVPPPPRLDRDLIASLGVPSRAIPGVPDLMHHKYAIRDAKTVWSGSANWTDDSWSREENVIVTVESTPVASAFGLDFDQLWRSREVAGSGNVEPRPEQVGAARVRAWFCPDRGTELAHRIARAIGDSRRRVRIASPVITSGPILGTLAEVAADGRVDVAGVVDATQIEEVYGQWRANEGTGWKLASLGQVLARADFSGKLSTPYRPGAVHDYMHAKITVADDVAFVGSFNLSHSGEMNAENVLEIKDARLCERLATFVDEIRSRYPRAPLPERSRDAREHSPRRGDR
jgi:phosphatidylserine/phosphatidylglycerophosphate/cardiolipin synthase-like enzyme